MKTKMENEMFCYSCGEAINANAEICVKCGVSQINRAITMQEVHCFSCGEKIKKEAEICVKCGVRQPAFKSRQSYVSPEDKEDVIIRNIAQYEKISWICWLILGIVQIIFVITIIAGLVNIFGALKRKKMPERIICRDSKIPREYEPITSLIVTGIVNLLLGGAIGIALTAFDFYIRNEVLSNKGLFTNDNA